MTGPLPEDIRSGFDIIGVRAGQSFDEAESIIREQINPIAEFASKSAPDQPSKTGFIRAFMNEDATQTIALFGPTENGPVIAVSRSFWRNGSTWPMERVVEGMFNKYGYGESYGDDDRSIWWSKSSSNNQGVCAQLPLSSPDGRFWEMSVVEGDPSSINWLDPLTYSPAIPLDQEGSIQNQRECDSVVQLTVPTGLESQSAQLFSIFLYAPQIADAVDFPKDSTGEQIDIEF